MKWGKFAIGLLLLPSLAAAVGAGLDLLATGEHGQVWRSPWCLALGAGGAVWWIVYVVFPRPMWIYVFGHELTHALAVYLAGGKVLAFKVGARGGYVATDKVNWWMTLAPYFIPLYGLIWIGLWWSVNFYYPLHAYAWLLYGGVGFTWGFHLTFTVNMIRAGQSDIESQGYLFSFVVILLINFLLMEIFLVSVISGMTWSLFGQNFSHRWWQSYVWSAQTLGQIGQTLWQAGRDFYHHLTA